MRDSGTTWTTYSETKFINNLGRWGNVKDAIRCLEGYIDSCQLRTDWGLLSNGDVAIDKDVCISCAEQRLEYLRGQI